MIKLLLLALLTMSYMKSSAQEPGHIYLAVSINSYKFERSDADYGASFIANIKVSKLLAMGVGLSPARFNGSSAGYNPFFGNISFLLLDKERLSLIADLHLGYASYNNDASYYMSTSYFESNTSGGFYTSPGVGCYVKISKNFAPFIKLAYMNGSFRHTATTTIRSTATEPQKVITTSNNYNLDGMLICIGVKIF